MSHSITFASQANIVMSMIRRCNNDTNHTIESAGQLMGLIGVFLTYLDSYTFDIDDINPSAFKFKMTKYIFRSTW